MSMTTTIKVQGRGVITLPKKIRQQVGFSDGTLVDVIAREGEIVMRPVTRLDGEIMADLQSALEDVHTGKTSPAFSSVKAFKEYMRMKRKKLPLRK